MDAYLFISAMAVYAMFVVGAAGSFLPILPGPFIASISMLAFKLIFPESELSWTAVIAAQLLMLAAQGADFVLTWIGAKKFGATWRGAFGAFLGVLVGIFIPPPLVWIFLAPFAFAFLFEYLGGADFRAAGKAGIGAFAGNLAASVFKFLTVVAMSVWFSLDLYL